MSLWPCVRRPSYPLCHHCCLLFVAVCGSLGLNSENKVGRRSVRKTWLDANIWKTSKVLVDLWCDQALRG